jgi:hypothetical protein
MSNNIHSPRFNVSFKNFDSFKGKNATLSASTTATIPGVINLEKTFLTNAANMSRAVTAAGSVTIDTDSSNNANVRTVKCIYPNTPSPPQKSITGYNINLNAITKCVNNPPQNYSPSYEENCLKFCNVLPNSMTPVKKYQCVDIPPATVPFFIPFGGWGDSTLSLVTNDIINKMSSSDRSKILGYLGDFQTKEVKVRDASGQPIYIANKNTTSELKTWTKLEDLCQ